MKSGLAAVMLAAGMLAASGGTGGDVVVAAVADEEYASAGTEAVVREIAADAAIVTEPTGLRLCAAHKGFAWIEIETRGRAAHGSKPDLGVDAIAHMGRVLTRLEELGHSLAAGPSHSLLGTGSLHASLVHGGQELSSYPERCSLQAERRTVPGESEAIVMQQVEDIISGLARQDQRFSASARLLFWREPFEVRTDEPIVQCVLTEATTVLGHPPDIYGDTPWMDAALLASAGIPTVVFGPGGAGAHATEEWASVSQTAICAEILARTALTFCDSVE
jgi:acetylornithine deacetylase